jgi:hypothetical protein
VDAMGRARAAMIENNIESLTQKVYESEQKIKNLRNLRKDIESKLLVENAWQRYIRDQIAVLKQVESTNSVLTNTED